MRALVLSGGGSKGAYEVGVLQHLLGRIGHQYEIVCGVSVGALNGAFLAQYELGKEFLAAQGLYELWEGLNDSSIYKSWFGWYLAALWKPSVYNSEPLQELVRRKLNVEAVRNSGRRLRVGAVNLETGVYKLFDEGYADLPGAVLASASFPVMLTPVELEGGTWTDGGVRNITPLKAAIDLGATAIDIVMCSPPQVKPLTKGLKALDIAFRAIDILTDEVNTNDIDKALLYNRLVGAGLESTKRNIELNIVRPDTELTDNPLDFSPRLLRAMRQRGIQDAEKVFGA